MDLWRCLTLIGEKHVNKQEATDFVIRELAKRRSRDDIITELCQRTGGTREQIQRFIQLVESQSRPTAAAPVSTPGSAPMPVARLARPAPAITPTPTPAPPSAPVETLNPPAPPPLGGKIGDAITQENIAFVISELGKHRNRNDLIMALCEKTGGSWNEMQRFVQQVESQNRQKITARQSPILIMIGVTTILMGLVLTVYMAIETWHGANYFLIGTPIPYSGNVFYGVTGLGMLGGGTLGTLRTLRSLMK
jgi:hypothetical protein